MDQSSAAESRRDPFRSAEYAPEESANIDPIKRLQPLYNDPAKSPGAGKLSSAGSSAQLEVQVVFELKAESGKRKAERRIRVLRIPDQ
eukprot:scaffold2771_cov252-Pinguiococcus_pyrenoidosus.AAC.26